MKLNVPHTYQMHKIKKNISIVDVICLIYLNETVAISPFIVQIQGHTFFFIKL